MKASELRIGNLVEAYTKDIQVRIIGIGEIRDVNGIMYEVCNIKPIPLTSDKLIEFGFKKHGDNCFRLGHMKFNYQKLPKGATGHDRVLIYGTIVLTHIYYVHQFQNLYFALCGSELILKDKQ